MSLNKEAETGHNYNLEELPFLLFCFYLRDQISITFLMHQLTSLSVDEISLPWYVDWSTNFRVLPLLGKMAVSSSKDRNIVFCCCFFFGGAGCLRKRQNPSCCLLQVIQQGFVWAIVVAKNDKSSAQSAKCCFELHPGSSNPPNSSCTATYFSSH